MHGSLLAIGCRLACIYRSTALSRSVTIIQSFLGGSLGTRISHRSGPQTMHCNSSSNIELPLLSASFGKVHVAIIKPTTVYMYVVTWTYAVRISHSSIWELITGHIQYLGAYNRSNTIGQQTKLNLITVSFSVQTLTLRTKRSLLEMIRCYIVKRYVTFLKVNFQRK